MNDYELLDIHVRRNHVLDLEDQWDATSTPEFVNELLDAALTSSADVDVLMTELSKLSRGRIALWNNAKK